MSHAPATVRQEGVDPAPRPSPARAAGVAVALLCALVWSYWPTIDSLVRDWQTDDNYSVGQIVPFAALYLLWHKRRELRGCPLGPCWWGGALILVAQVARAGGLILLFESAERYSLVLSIAGLVLLLAGVDVFRRVGPILLFLVLMVPLPGRIHNAISAPLQGQAAGGAIFVLELLGVTVVREGNLMVLDDTISVGVAEACSGLRMLTAFVVVGSVLAYVIARPRWQKFVMLISTVPVAIVCNIVRLVITAELFRVTSSETAERFFHDFAGWTMMPMAVMCLLAELWVMSRLVLPDTSSIDPINAPLHTSTG